eukprot:COSAG01_NODE_45808_length_406_cov_0.671010_1_plen_52_part_01
MGRRWHLVRLGGMGWGGLLCHHGLLTPALPALALSWCPTFGGDLNSSISSSS